MTEQKAVPTDAFSAYEVGLRQLLDKLGRDHSRHTEALTYQQRLEENLSQVRRYGDTETRGAARAEIVDRLNELALTELGVSFNELCGLLSPQAQFEPELIHIEVNEQPQPFGSRLRSLPRLALAVGVGIILIVCLIAVAVIGTRLVGYTGRQEAVDATQTALAVILAAQDEDTPTPQAPSATPQTPLETPTLGLDRTLVREKDGMEMVYVPGDTFEMGSTEAEIDAAFEQCEQVRGSGQCERSWFERESPQHSVTLDGFWIDRTEVTNAQYARCVADATCNPPSGSHSYTPDSYYGDSQFDDYPVIYVDWEDADTYCQWVEAGGRLPTEAEWEYAARGPERRVYPWGNDPPDDTLVNYNQNVGDTTPVGSYVKGESWVGALDMAGNVWEWVNDSYDNDYYASSPAENPIGPDAGDFKVLRGGSWDYYPDVMRSASRSGNYHVNRRSDVGFRCVVASTSSP